MSPKTKCWLSKYELPIAKCLLGFAACYLAFVDGQAAGRPGAASIVFLSSIACNLAIVLIVVLPFKPKPVEEAPPAGQIFDMTGPDGRLSVECRLGMPLLSTEQINEFYERFVSWQYEFPTEYIQLDMLKCGDTHTANVIY